MPNNNYIKKQINRMGNYAKSKPVLYNLLKGTRDHLRSSGLITYIYAYYDKLHPSDEMLKMKEFVQQNTAAIKKVSDMLCDEKSKLVYNGIIDFRHTRNFKSIKPFRQLMCASPHYFVSDIISLTPEEVFIDGGAYDGDTIFDFVKETQGKYKEIIAFEPSHENLIKLNDKLKKASISNVTIHEAGLWNKKDTLVFFDDGNASHVDNLMMDVAQPWFVRPEAKGEIEIKVNTIDNIAFDKAPTFIKMDIEGAELEALEGAQKTIRQYKPKLAISLYHKNSDFVSIPLYIKELVPEYKLYVRQHSHYVNETVLYAVI